MREVLRVRLHELVDAERHVQREVREPHGIEMLNGDELDPVADAESVEPGIDHLTVVQLTDDVHRRVVEIRPS